jgi:hypothetical protein
MTQNGGYQWHLLMYAMHTNSNVYLEDVLISAGSYDDTKNNETKQDDSYTNNDNTNHEQKN